MTPANRHILLGTLVSVSLVALLTIESRPVAHAARVPKGTPINLVMNVHPKDLKAVVQAYVDGVLQGAPKEKFAELQPQTTLRRFNVCRRKCWKSVSARTS